MIVNQIYVDGLAAIMTRIFNLTSGQWEESKLTIGELRLGIANLKEDLTNSHVNKVVVSKKRVSDGGTNDPKKIKISYEQVRDHDSVI